MSLLILLIAHFQKWTVAAVFLLLLASTLAYGQAAKTLAFDIGEEHYRIELATTPEARSRGLMFREHLDPRGGMLLAYSSDGDHRIWMKNVPIALRVYWLDSAFEVIAMRRLPPCKSNPCPVYAAPKPSRYVLELADREHGLQPGDRISGLDSLLP